MNNIEFALKLYLIWFVAVFLLGVAINLTTKKEYRQSLRDLVIEHVRMTSAITAVATAICAFAWFLFKVV